MAAVNFLMLATFSTAARRCGVNLGEVLEELGLDIDMTAHSDERLPLELLKDLFDVCEKRAQRSYFPVETGLAFNFEGLTEVKAFLTSSSNLRQAFRAAEWSPRLIHPNLFFLPDFRDQTLGLRVEVRHPDPALNDLPALVDMVLAVAQKTLNDMVPGVSVIERIELKHAPQTHRIDYQELMGCPVLFEQPASRAVFKPDLMEMPLPGSLPAAHAKAEVMIQKRIRALDHRLDLICKIENLMESRLSLLGEPLGVAAEMLDMHPRTLQRRLKALGARYSDIQDGVRHRLARQMLKNTDLDIESIAFKLGYQDRRSFTAAFARWERVTPRDFRQTVCIGRPGSESR